MRRFLVTGAEGQLGSAVCNELVVRGETVVATGSGRASTRDVGTPAGCPLDVTDPVAVARVVADARATHVVHCAAVASMAVAHRDPDRAHRVNAAAVDYLVSACRREGARLVYPSTDAVFDGERAPYAEADEPEPTSVYAKTKRAGELLTLGFDDGVVARLPLLFGVPRVTKSSFWTQQIEALERGEQIDLFHDEFRTPLCLDDAARGIVALAASEATGVVHLPGPERLSRYEMGVTLARSLGASPDLVVATSRAGVSFPEPRPRDVSLVSHRVSAALPNWRPRTLTETLKR